MSEPKPKGIKVDVIKYHTFAGKEYHEGDSYEVVGDGHQTAEQYLETLHAVGFAQRSKPTAVASVRQLQPSQPVEAMKAEAQDKMVEHRTPSVKTVKK